MRVSKTLNIAELRRIAKGRCPKFVFDYMDGAVEDELGVAENQAALRRAQIVPRYLVDVTVRDQTTELFGRTYAHPFGVAPMGIANMVWPGTDANLARKAAAANIPYTLSTVATTSIEEAAAAAGENFWFQLYSPRDHAVRDDLVRRADEAGAEVLMVTVDVPVAAKRERDMRNGLSLPFRFTPKHVTSAMVRPGWSMRLVRNGNPRFAVLERYADPKAGIAPQAGFVASQVARVFTWEDFDKLRRDWPRKLLIKGVMAVEDALEARRRGGDGIVLSNHGGRQLDAAPAPFDLIQPIRQAVGPGFAIIADSGVRRGADVAKMLAAGADFVLCGRAFLYGAAAGGPAGIEKSYEFLRDELDRCMAQVGATDIDALRALPLRRADAS